MIASSFVLVLSFLEIVAVLREIHSHVSEVKKKDEVEKKIEEIIEKFEGKPTVKKIIEQFCETAKAEYPRSYLYQIVCDVLEKSKNKTKGA